MAFRVHRKRSLLELVVQSLYDDAWNILYLHDPRYHPFILKVYKKDVSIDVRIYIWNITHGGGSARAADEYRIQITSVDDEFEQQPNGLTLILGWWEEGKVFAGFDYNYHSGTLGSSPSIQIREEALRNARLNGFSAWQRGNQEIAVAIRPDMLGEYIKDLPILHSFGQSRHDLDVLDTVANQDQAVNDMLLNSVTIERRVVVKEVAKKLRDVGFKSRILTAYGAACSFCGLQLKLTDAAHILPVEQNGSDETWNGIALCALHHRAYDRSLVTFDENYRIHLNRSTLETLRQKGHDSGRQQFETNLRDIIALPAAISDRPHVDSIIQANQIRGWDF